ncbi:MAG: hypothetical protein NXI22_16375 [bacterium]|nr:hypothetical protein [bacterium]
MSTKERKTEILASFLESCQQSTQLPLGFLEVDENVFACPPEPREIVRALTEEFSMADLMDSGILVATEGEGVTLSPAVTDNASFVVLRDAETQQPYELLTNSGCLDKHALPAFEILRDQYTQRLIERGSGHLFFAFDVEHVVMLRAAEIPATLAIGLEHLSLERVKLLSDAYGLTYFGSDGKTSGEETEARRASPPYGGPKYPLHSIAPNLTNGRDAATARDSTAPPAGPTCDPGQSMSAQIVFLAWSPLELSNTVPQQLKAILHHLRQLHRFLDVDVDEILVWEGDDETLERLRFIAERRSSAIFQVALREATESIDASIAQFGREQPPVTGPPIEYTTALTRLTDSSSREGGLGLLGKGSRTEAWRDVQRLLSQQVVGPLRDVAIASSNPVERTMLLGLAELSNMFHLQSVAISEQFHHRMADHGVERGAQLPEAQFKNLIAIADRLIGMAKATEQCRQPRTMIVESRNKDSPSIPRLPNSG